MKPYVMTTLFVIGVLLTMTTAITTTTNVFYPASFAQNPVPDLETPHITAPDNLIINATKNTPYTTAVVITPRLGVPTVTDNADPSPVITNNAPSDTVFPIGITLVIWTATDAAGNTASAAQRVLVEDTTSPQITAMPHRTVISDASITVLAPHQTGVPVSTDTVDPFPVITSNLTERRNIGNSTVHWTATDAAGNTATVIQPITIKSVAAPSLVRPNVTIVSDTFDASISPWSAWGRPLHAFPSFDCEPSSSNRHRVTHSAQNNGSAYFDLNGACGVEYIGMQRSFTFGPKLNGYDLQFSFDYRSVANAETTAPRIYLISSYGSGGPENTQAWTITPSIPTNNTGWITHTATTRLADSDVCPCRLLVFEFANSVNAATAYVDNVRVTAIPVSRASGSGDAPNSLTTQEIFSMLSDNQRVLFLSKTTQDTHITVSWDTQTYLPPYKLVIAPVSDPQNKSSEITQNDTHTFENLQPDTSYFVSVGVRGNDSTQTTLIATTGGTPFNSKLKLDAKLIKNSDTIQLSWDDLNGMGQNTYRVQRLVDGISLAQFAPNSQTGTATDTVKPDWLGDDISYRIFEKIGTHKILSNVATVHVPSTLNPVKKLYVSSVESSGDILRVQLDWEHAPLFRKYLVEQQKPDGTWSRPERTTENTYTYEMPDTGNTVTVLFRVTAQLGFVQSEPSEIRHTIYASVRSNTIHD